LKWGGLEFTTALGGRETWYAGVSEGDESRTRQLWDFQTSLGSDLYRVFDTGWENVPKIKHVLRPEISYLYIPDVDQSNIPYYDQAVPKTNAVFYGVTNRVIAKIVEKSQTRYHEYLYFKIGQRTISTRPPGPGPVDGAPQAFHASEFGSKDCSTFMKTSPVTTPTKTIFRPYTPSN
jgi:hypothetical protein